MNRDEETAIRQRLKDDFPHYAEKCLKIRPKAGGLIPFKLNRVQLHIHEALERQLAETGKVRALILKARQPGCSTLVEGRYYHKVVHRHGVRAFILTHKQEASDNLFDMTERFHENCPPAMRPHTGASNAKELSFDLLDSGYKVGTAGTEGVGRSETIQFFHGSEVAYWKNADAHMGGILQAVPGEPDTEIILESTANGLGGLFYAMCKAAERGDSEYRLIFIPWFWHDEYRATSPDDWRPPTEFRKYGDMLDLGADQLYWAYLKNRELAHATSADADELCWKFRQEYPATAEEAFQSGADATFIKSESVYKARKNTVETSSRTPIVVGVDPARGGSDRTRVIDRQGRKMGGHTNFTLDTDDTMVVAGHVAKMIGKIEPHAVFIDVTGLGAGVYDRLCEMGYGEIVDGVNFAQSPIDGEKYANKRAEMWDLLREWFEDPAGVDIPDNDGLHSELCAPVWGRGATRYDSSGRIILEAKEHIKERLGSSPDGADAAALTFAFPVSAHDEDDWYGKHWEQPTAGGRSEITGY
ncbi:MAG: hypothetical protein IIA01_00210 [Proteobacteria bacterium]|nr:hypothetical protein [Pseudomonadota bacterium]